MGASAVIGRRCLHVLASLSGRYTAKLAKGHARGAAV